MIQKDVKQDLGIIMSNISTWCKEISQSDDLEYINKRVCLMHGAIKSTFKEICDPLLPSELPIDLSWIVKWIKKAKTELDKDNTAKD